jgi:tetratricopeptide (TPR) repeat protein
MKLRYTLVISLALVIAFFTAQSFYHRFTQRNDTPSAQIWFRSFPGHAALCAPIYVDADSAINIPALKGWGNYKFRITTSSDSAQYYFNQGLSMYYAFHSIEAIASFIKATRFDPECAMAWYGKSLAMGPNINFPNGYKAAVGAYEASVKAQLYMAACTPVEKDLIHAMQQRYSGDTTISVKQLRTNYAAAMQMVYMKYPKDADVATLYADALLLLHPWDLYTHDFKPKPWTPQIRALLEQALAICPKHPGANHYYIHTMEASATPELALNSAHILDTLMPLVAHITHMPSHIYIRTGDYARGIKDNDRALAGYNIYLKQYGPVVNDAILYQLHNMHLRINCAQMGGNYKIAITGSNELVADIPTYYLSSKGSDGNFIQYIYMEPTLTNVRFGKWDDILNRKPIDSLAYASILLHFSKGLAWCGKGQPAKAQLELKALNSRMQDTSLKAPVDNFSCAYDAACVAQLILQGVIAENKKQYATAIITLQKAVAAEDKIIYNEPRDWPIPARQYLADALLKAGKYNDAIAILNRDLMVNPNNGWALTGLQLAYKGTRNTIALTKVNQQLKTSWQIKDVEIDRPVF